MSHTFREKINNFSAKYFKELPNYAPETTNHGVKIYDITPPKYPYDTDLYIFQDTERRSKANTIDYYLEKLQLSQKFRLKLSEFMSRSTESNDNRNYDTTITEEIHKVKKSLPQHDDLRQRQKRRPFKGRMPDVCFGKNPEGNL